MILHKWEVLLVPQGGRRRGMDRVKVKKIGVRAKFNAMREGTTHSNPLNRCNTLQHTATCRILVYSKATGGSLTTKRER